MEWALLAENVSIVWHRARQHNQQRSEECDHGIRQNADHVVSISSSVPCCREDVLYGE